MKQKRLEIITQTQDTQTMLLRILSKMLIEKKRWTSNTAVVIWWKKTFYNRFAIFLEEWKTLCIDKVQHLSCAIFKGICSCGEVYVGETIRNCKIRYDEYNDVNKNSKPAKHLARNIEHKFSWYMLARAPVNTLKRRILEAYFIKLIVPSLNGQLDNDVLMLFRNGVRWYIF